MAPELLEGNYDEKVDVWTVGIITYMLLCGERPFEGRTDEEVIKNIQEKLVVDVNK